MDQIYPELEIKRDSEKKKKTMEEFFLEARSSNQLIMLKVLKID